MRKERKERKRGQSVNRNSEFGLDKGHPLLETWAEFLKDPSLLSDMLFTSHRHYKAPRHPF